MGLAPVPDFGSNFRPASESRGAEQNFLDKRDGYLRGENYKGNKANPGSPVVGKNKSTSKRDDGDPFSTNNGEIDVNAITEREKFEEIFSEDDMRCMMPKLQTPTYKQLKRQQRNSFAGQRNSWGNNNRLSNHGAAPRDSSDNLLNRSNQNIQVSASGERFSFGTPGGNFLQQNPDGSIDLESAPDSGDESPSPFNFQSAWGLGFGCNSPKLPHLPTAEENARKKERANFQEKWRYYLQNFLNSEYNGDEFEDESINGDNDSEIDSSSDFAYAHIQVPSTETYRVSGDVRGNSSAAAGTRTSATGARPRHENPENLAGNDQLQLSSVLAQNAAAGGAFNNDPGSDFERDVGIVRGSGQLPGTSPSGRSSGDFAGSSSVLSGPGLLSSNFTADLHDEHSDSNLGSSSAPFTPPNLPPWSSPNSSPPASPLGEGGGATMNPAGRSSLLGAAHQLPKPFFAGVPLSSTSPQRFSNVPGVVLPPLEPPPGFKMADPNTFMRKSTPGGDSIISNAGSDIDQDSAFFRSTTGEQDKAINNNFPSNGLHGPATPASPRDNKQKVTVMKTVKVKKTWQKIIVDALKTTGGNEFQFIRDGATGEANFAGAAAAAGDHGGTSFHTGGSATPATVTPDGTPVQPNPGALFYEKDRQQLQQRPASDPLWWRHVKVEYKMPVSLLNDPLLTFSKLQKLFLKINNRVFSIEGHTDHSRAPYDAISMG
ncbi:unnamed protein product [Amoebophrya sp. A120]|nr:unnamed protein product [Amoebophrya sp. A120]|eukprot:GSA120T00019250001.1